jgi:hypothetical protein
MLIGRAKISESTDMNAKLRAACKFTSETYRLFPDSTDNDITEIATSTSPIPQEFKHQVSLKGEPTRAENDEQNEERSADV